MQSVLVTGASRGIGKTIATHLAASGWDVIAGVRTEADGARLRAEDSRLTPVMLDVTDENTLLPLTNRYHIDSTPWSTMPGSRSAVRWRRCRGRTAQATGHQRHRPDRGDAGCAAAVARLTRPSRVHFEPERQDRIPAVRCYCASKFAIEAAADSLRIELKPWGIHVSVVEPAQTDTDMWRTAEPGGRHRRRHDR